jgi:8-oxo-dGTP pyrophosphatase MutT (NUDIX family)
VSKLEAVNAGVDKTDAMQLGVFTAIVLRHPHEDAVLLLRRSQSKRRFPDLITGIGGQVELALGEGEDLGASMLREFQEETNIALDTVADIHCRLSTIITRGDLQVLLLWFTGRLMSMPDDLSCTEGELEFFDIGALPSEQMIPTARRAVPFILALPEDDPRIYNGCFSADGQLITNHD